MKNSIRLRIANLLCFAFLLSPAVNAEGGVATNKAQSVAAKTNASGPAIGSATSGSPATSSATTGAATAAAINDPKKLPPSYWRSRLDAQTYNVTRCSATEAPFTGKYWNEHKAGSYLCSNCGEPLFDSKDKFDSGSGWPSFTKTAGKVEVKNDNTMGMNREEVVCKHCGAHLGHVFNDGPAPTGMRYCINSASLNLKPVDAKK